MTLSTYFAWLSTWLKGEPKTKGAFMNISNYDFKGVDVNNVNLGQYTGILQVFSEYDGVWDLYGNILNAYIAKGLDNPQAVIQAVTTLVYTLNIFQSIGGNMGTTSGSHQGSNVRAAS